MAEKISRVIQLFCIQVQVGLGRLDKVEKFVTAAMSEA